MQAAPEAKAASPKKTLPKKRPRPDTPEQTECLPTTTGPKKNKTAKAKAKATAKTVSKRPAKKDDKQTEPSTDPYRNNTGQGGKPATAYEAPRRSRQVLIPDSPCQQHVAWHMFILQVKLTLLRGEALRPPPCTPHPLPNRHPPT